MSLYARSLFAGTGGSGGSGGAGVTGLTAFGSTPNAAGGDISGNLLTLEPASASFPGGVSTGTQSFAGAKTFVTLGANQTASSTISIVAKGIANAYTAQLLGSIVSGQSYGLNILAGTTSADAGLTVSNQLGTLVFFNVAGNGAVTTRYNTLDDGGGSMIVYDSLSTPAIAMPGSGSGTIQILPQAAAGTYNFNLPTTAGTSGYLLTSAGGVAAPMTWTNPTTLTPTFSGLTTDGVMYATSATAIASTAAGITGQALVGVTSGTPTWLNYTALNTNSTLVYRDSTGTSFANNFVSASTSTATAGGTTVLTSSSTRYQIFTGLLNQTIQLPDVTTLTVGATFEINSNNTTGLLTVKDNGSNTLFTISPGAYLIIILQVNGFPNGVWDRHACIPANASWSTSGLSATGTVTATSTVQGTQLISTIATGTAPLTVASTTLVANLHAATADSSTSTTTATNLVVTAGGAGTYYPLLVPNATSSSEGATTNTSISVNNNTSVLTAAGLSAGQITSTVSTGTAPLVVASTTQVANLNAATAGSSTTSTTATNLAGGANGSVPYQTGSGTTTMLAAGSNTNVLTLAGGVPTWAAPATSGTVTSVSVTTANGVSGSVATATTTPAITLTLAAITPTTVAGTDATDSTTSTTGAFTTAGGLGVAKAVTIGTTLKVTTTSTLTGSTLVGVGTANQGGETVGLTVGSNAGANTTGGIEILGNRSSTSGRIGSIYGYQTTNAVTRIDFNQDGAVNSGKITLNTSTAGSMNAALTVDHLQNVSTLAGFATAGYDTSTSTSGTITASANKPGLVINSAGGTTLTIKLPSSPIDGQQYFVSSVGAFTTITWQDSGGTAGNVIGGQVALGGVNRGQTFVYSTGLTKWLAIS